MIDDHSAADCKKVATFLQSPAIWSVSVGCTKAGGFRGESTRNRSSLPSFADLTGVNPSAAPLGADLPWVLLQLKGTIMSDTQEQWQALVDRLRQERDELRLRLHLGTAEARDEWDKVEAKWAEVEARMPQVKAELRDGGQNLRAALDMVTEEISSRYERIRKLF